jgi:isopentenyl-diphosphate delta-isomerase
MNKVLKSKNEEALIVVDKQDGIIGYESKERCHEGKGLLHRAFSILIFNNQKQLLLQKRSKLKLLWPLHWSNSVCSHPRAGESYEEAAGRRLNEEIGLEVPLQFLYKFQYQADFKNIGREKEMCCVYIGRANGKVRANKNEIDDWKYIEIEMLNKHISAHVEKYTPWFLMEWRHIRKNYLADIQKL